MRAQIGRTEASATRSIRKIKCPPGSGGRFGLLAVLFALILFVRVILGMAVLTVLAGFVRLVGSILTVFHNLPP